MNPSSLLLLILTASLLISSCSTSPKDGPPPYPFNAEQVTEPTPIPLPKNKGANPTSYVIQGKRYYVKKNALGYNQQGVASWYGSKFQGRLTSSGEPYDMFKLTAASKTLPIPTFVKVTNLENGRSTIVKVNDRGPFKPGRLIDLSYAAAKKLQFAEKGTTWVNIQAITFDKPHTQPYLQLAVFSTQESAAKLSRHVRNLTHAPVSIDRIVRKKKTFFRVKVGPLKNYAASSNLANLLKPLHLGRVLQIFG